MKKIANYLALYWIILCLAAVLSQSEIIKILAVSFTGTIPLTLTLYWLSRTESEQLLD